jgi:hypothetical protein
VRPGKPTKYYRNYVFDLWSHNGAFVRGFQVIMFTIVGVTNNLFYTLRYYMSLHRRRLHTKQDIFLFLHTLYHRTCTCIEYK